MAVSYATNIRPLIRQIDIDHMLFFCDLSNYNDVKTNAAEILSRLNGTGGPVMPPKKNGGPWKPENVTLFAQWIADGCQP
jgi:hypothetical protein